MRVMEAATGVRGRAKGCPPRYVQVERRMKTAGMTEVWALGMWIESRGRGRRKRLHMRNARTPRLAPIEPSTLLTLTCFLTG